MIGLPIGIPRQIRAASRRRDTHHDYGVGSSLILSVTGVALKQQLAKRIAEDRAWCERQEARLRNDFTTAMRDGLVDLPDAVEYETTPPRTVLEEESETIAFHEFLITILADDERYEMSYTELRSLLAPIRPLWTLGGRGCP